TLTINQSTDSTFGVGAVATLTSVITGTGSIIKAGVGTLTLTSANTYTGTTTVNAGTLITSGAGVVSGDVTVGASGTLTIGNAQTLSNLSGSGAVNANAAITVANTSPAVSTFSGTLNGSSALNKSGTGTLSLGGNSASTYSGAVNVSAGVVKAATTGALGSGTVTLSAGSVLGGSGATTTNNIVIGTAGTSDTSSYAAATNLLTWSLGTVTNPNPTPLAATTVAAGGTITTTGLTRSGFTAGTLTDGWGGSVFNYADAAAAITASAFATVNITTTSLLNIKSVLASTYYRSGTGARNTLWQYKIGSGNYVDITTVALGTGTSATTISQGSIDLSGISALTLLEPP
ncbi:MAG: hypothetical protein EBT37_11445, partial [Betaproteobacteria bacterium]|nr:hypothetical protein [Betaproteobacteria bacterium]